MKTFLFTAVACIFASRITFAQDTFTMIEPKAATWHARGVPSVVQIRPPAPPNSQSTAAEIQTLKSLIAEADADTMAQVVYWDAGAPAYRWLAIAYQQMQAQRLAPTLVTRGMALTSVAIYDA